MRNNKWPDFLFTIAVRFVCGIVLGSLACLLFVGGLLRGFAHNDIYGPLIWLGLCGLVGGIVAVFTVPRWQTPWYKRDAEDFSISAGLRSPGRDRIEPDSKAMRKSVTIRTIGTDGAQHEYFSLEEVPSEFRSRIEALEKEVMQGKGEESRVVESSPTGFTITSKIRHRKSVSDYQIVDESGVERVYQSLEEMPPEIRAAVAEAQKKSK